LSRAANGSCSWEPVQRIDLLETNRLGIPGPIADKGW